MEADQNDTAARIADVAARRGIRIATAESFTGGLLAAELSRASAMDAWYRGGLVACAPEVKRQVLYVRAGPIVSERAVIDMADGVALLLGATTSVAVSGVAGPNPDEDHQPGTVWIGVRHGPSTVAELRHLTGTPDDICAATCSGALDLLLRRLTAEER